jgi:photosystem II stability/assembly factor-like uncharacterized protein
MLIVGSEDGIYRLSTLEASTDRTAERLLDSGPVMRLRQFDEFDGLFAATERGLYHSQRGDEWTDLNVPEQQVYAVGARREGRLYAGTRPAHLFVAEPGPDDPTGQVAWRELDGLQSVPSRDEWRLPRHENLAQIRDVHAPTDADDRIVAAVEVGGVHVSDDGGETWTERRDGVHDDVHELRVTGPDEFVAATGFGMFRTTDAGRSWTRLDEGYEQRYFRSVVSVDDAIYAGAAMAHTATWDDADADPALFVCRDGERLERIEHPCPSETITGLAAADGAVVAGTHRGTVLARRGDDWTMAGALPVDDDFAGSYTPLLWIDD